MSGGASWLNGGLDFDSDVKNLGFKSPNIGLNAKLQ